VEEDSEEGGLRPAEGGDARVGRLAPVAARGKPVTREVRERMRREEHERVVIVGEERGVEEGSG